MKGQRIVLMGSTDDGDDNGVSPRPKRQLGSTDSSDGHLRSSSDFEAATSSAASATATATATTIAGRLLSSSAGLGDTDDPNGYHSLPSPEALASDNAIRSIDGNIADDDGADVESAQQAAAPQHHINHNQNNRHDHTPLAPPRLLNIVPSNSASVVDPETATEIPDLTAHLNKHFIMELIAWYRNRSFLKKLITALFFVIACVVYADLFGLFWEDSKIHHGLELFLEWMDHHSVAACFAFIGMFILTTLIFVPPSLMTFGAGFVFVEVYGFAWGMALAMVVCFLGSCLGAMIAFVRARYMTRDLVKLFAKRYPIIRAVDKGLKRSGFKVMVLLRLCSIIPFSALNYIGGVTGVTIVSFAYSMVGILPSQLLTVLFGATAGSLKNSSIAEEWTVSNIIWLSVTGACGLLAIMLTIYFARKEIKKELERDDVQSLAPGSLRSMTPQAGDDFESDGSTGGGRERRSEE